MPEQRRALPKCGGKGTKKDGGCGGDLMALVPVHNRAKASEYYCPQGTGCHRSYLMSADQITATLHLGLVREV